MTREDTIKEIEEQYKICKAFYNLSANPQQDYPGGTEYMEALRMALYALRAITQTDNDQTAKADAGKARLTLVPFQIVYDIARVREHGTMKYGDPANWKQVEPQRYVDALLRHTLAFAEDMHSTDQESGLPHLWHAACNIAFLCELLKEENNGQTL